MLFKSIKALFGMKIMNDTTKKAWKAKGTHIHNQSALFLILNHYINLINSTDREKNIMYLLFDAEIFLLTGEETTARLLVDEVSGDRVGLLFRVVLSDPVIDKLDKLEKIKAERLENTVAF